MMKDKIEKAQQVLSQDTTLLPEFWVNKYKDEAARNWDLFYKRNTTNFFKDRHWTEREFKELASLENGGKTVLLELGCGVGNFIYPLLRNHPNLFVHACDFSPRAIEFVKENAEYDSNRLNAFVCDLTKDSLRQSIKDNPINLISAIFVLSAIPIEKLPFVLTNVYNICEAGSMVIVRDYGLYDQAQLRFKPGQRIDDNVYVRQDGTLARYFTKEELSAGFKEAGFETVSVEYIYSESCNRKTGVKMERVFVQGKFKRL